MKLLSMITLAALLVAGAFTVTGCNTARGVGQDMESVGGAMQDTAR